MTGHQCTGAKNLNMQEQSEQTQDVIITSLDVIQSSTTHYPSSRVGGLHMQVGDLVEYIGAARIAVRTGDIGYVENIVYSQNTKIYHVRTLFNGKLRRFNKHHLKVVQ